MCLLMWLLNVFLKTYICERALLALDPFGVWFTVFTSLCQCLQYNSMKSVNSHVLLISFHSVIYFNQISAHVRIRVERTVFTTQIFVISSFYFFLKKKNCFPNSCSWIPKVYLVLQVTYYQLSLCTISDIVALT